MQNSNSTLLLFLEVVNLQAIHFLYGCVSFLNPVCTRVSVSKCSSQTIFMIALLLSENKQVLSGNATIIDNRQIRGTMWRRPRTQTQTNFIISGI